MKPVNIYNLTRIKDDETMSKLERQMSRRFHPLNVKSWETDGLKALAEHLLPFFKDASKLTFYYSFIMPKLGKEFDLLRISDDTVINIELKSGNVSDDVVKMQLMHNKYYLSTLGKSTHYYTYLSIPDRLVRLSRTGKIIDASFEELALLISAQEPCYSDDIEELFKEDKFLISPLTDPFRFLRGEYFLTSQQRDIKSKILKRLKQHNNDDKEPAIMGFTGFPGTGKTILLYDLAMSLSRYERVALLHFGGYIEELEQLNTHLKRVDFLYFEDNAENIDLLGDYAYLLVDEAHMASTAAIKNILELGKKLNSPVIFSYDLEDVISPFERDEYSGDLIEKIPGFTGFRLTNRIRVNSELSTFIRSLLSCSGKNTRKDYPSVRISYANDNSELNTLLSSYESENYVYIRDSSLLESYGDHLDKGHVIDSSLATCKEFDKVMMIMDETFYYDHDGYLRADHNNNRLETAQVRNIYHGLSRAKNSIAVIIKENKPVLDTVLSILQGR